MLDISIQTWNQTQVVSFAPEHSTQHSHMLAVWDPVSSVSSILSDQHQNKHVTSGNFFYLKKKQ